MNQDDPSQPTQPKQTPQAPDPFDRVYRSMAEQAIHKGLDPPSREQWDGIVLRLVSSLDPERVRLYRNIEARGEDSLGADAYALWRKLPDYMPNRAIPAATWPAFEAYEREHIGSMRRLMEGQGLGERYAAMVAGRQTSGEAALEGDKQPVDRARAKRAQVGVIVIGCVGLVTIAVMLLTVLLIIALKMSS